jgi:Rieske Fe-S protein
VERGLFRCPCHGSTFSRDEAEVVFGPAGRPLDALPVRIQDGHVLVTVRAGSERRRQRGESAPAVRA